MGKRRRVVTPYTVKSYWRSDRERYQLIAKDNRTGKAVCYRTLPASIRREADAGRAAAALELELEEQGIAEEVGWTVARARFAREYMAGKSHDYQRQWRTVGNKIAGSDAPPETIYDLDTSWFSSWSAEMFEAELAASSVRTNLTVAGVFVRWAGRIWQAYRPPLIDLPPTGDDMKGRPICREELDRIIAKLPAVVGEEHAPSWEFATRGLDVSGLRRTEALKLRYDSQSGDDFHVRHLGHRTRRPVFVITSGDNKSRKALEFPVAPEFAEFLLQVPEADRTGFVFRPTLRKGRVNVSTLTRRITRAAELAGVIVGDHLQLDPETNIKTRVPSYASPHDLRRSFGDRGADRWPELVLMAMMRHKSIETTRRYYRGKNAQRTADVVWRLYEQEQQSGNAFTDQTTDQTASDSLAEKRKS